MPVYAPPEDEGQPKEQPESKPKEKKPESPLQSAIKGAGKSIADSLNQNAQSAVSNMNDFGAAPTPTKVDVAPMKLPSYQKGCKSVPKTGPAVLHKGERVLSKPEVRKLERGKAKRFSSGRRGGR